MKLPLTAVACLLATAALAGCGGGDNKSSSNSNSSKAPASSGIKTTTSASTGGSKTVPIGMKDLQFGPKLVTVRVGQTVQWTNDEAIPHNVTAKKGATFKSSTMQKGDKSTKAGTVAYVCTFHPGMVGTLNVSK
jgi:plastocyanin